MTYISIYTMIGLLFLSIAQPSYTLPLNDGSDFPLSPRHVNTKYGTLRGVVIPMRQPLQSPTSAPSSSAPSSPSPPPFTTMTTLPSVEAFFGIPYASPPTKSLRFMPPVTPTHWRGVRVANMLSPVCRQRLLDIDNRTQEFRQMSTAKLEHLKRVLPYLRNQSEDCLYLNIYAPYHSLGGQSFGSSSSASPQPFKYPVFVFIHGESYEWGSGNSFDGSILASFGQVIVVTLNYRLGVLGFLPAVVEGTPRGNYGLMDQVAALHWIQENIHEFGGHGQNITVVGHSYGAACVHLLMLSPMAKGLFTRVILMSGSALSPWAIVKDSNNHALHLAKIVNCPTLDNVVMIECLRHKNVIDILNVNFVSPQHLSTFGPIIDGIVVPLDPKLMMQNGPIDMNHHLQNSFLSPSPSSLFSPLNYDVLFGVTRMESPSIFSVHEEKHGIDLGRRDRILRTLVRNLYDFNQQAILLTLINEYTDWSRPIEHPINLLESTIDILSDALVVAPVIETGDIYTKMTRNEHNDQTNHNVQTSSSSLITSDSRDLRSYFYVFGYQGDDSNGKHQYHNRLGLYHGEELAYLFGAPLSNQLLGRPIGHFNNNYSKSEVTLSEAIITYWVNFAKYGDPNIWPHELDSHGDRTKGRFESVVWPQYDPVQKKYLMIGMKPKVRDHYHSHRLSFWLKLIPGLNQPSQDEELYLNHHLLTNHDNFESYDGIVRQIELKFLQPLPTISAQLSSITTEKPFQSKNYQSSTPQPKQLTTHVPKIETSAQYNNSNKTMFTAILMPESTDDSSTALSMTIAIGGSLLILNIIIFAGVYYHLNKIKKRSKHRNAFNDNSPEESVMLNISIPSSLTCNKCPSENILSPTRSSHRTPITSNMCPSGAVMEQIERVYCDGGNVRTIKSSSCSLCSKLMANCNSYGQCSEQLNHMQTLPPLKPILKCSKCNCSGIYNTNKKTDKNEIIMNYLPLNDQSSPIVKEITNN